MHRRNGGLRWSTLYRVTGVIDCDLHWWSTGWCAWRGGSLAHARRGSRQFRLTVRALRGFGDFGLRILVSWGPQGDPSNTDCGIVSFWLSVSGCDGRCRREFTEASSAGKLNADESKERCDAEEVHRIRCYAEYQPAVPSTGRAAPRWRLGMSHLQKACSRI
jgi:hypothetical protein